MKRIDAPQIVKSLTDARHFDDVDLMYENVDKIEYCQGLYLAAHISYTDMNDRVLCEEVRYFSTNDVDDAIKAIHSHEILGFNKVFHSHEILDEDSPLHEYMTGKLALTDEYIYWVLHEVEYELEQTETDFTRQYSTKLAEQVLPMAWNGQQSIYEVTTDKGLIQLVAFIDHDSYLKYEVYRGGRKLLQSEVQSFLSDLRIFNVKDLSPEPVAA